jgi:xylulokinase
MYLGFDIGTSGVKAVLLDNDGVITHQSIAEYSVANPRPLWSEQDPALWWDGCCRATRALQLAGAPLSSLRAIGLSGQMHGATLLDSRREVLRPCILWNDGRSVVECAELEASVPDFRALSGNMAMPGFTAPKLLWVKKHEPEIFDRTATVLLPKDYIRYRMTGACATDMSDAGGTLWLNPSRRDWDDTLLAATGLQRRHMPALYEGPDQVAELSPGAAAALALPRVPVVAGAADNAAGAVGCGVTEPGQGFLSLGTSGVLMVVSDHHHERPERAVHAYCHCLPGRWQNLAVSLAAGNSLAWLARTVDVSVPDLLARLVSSGKTETAVLFLPYLCGERTPHNDPWAVAQFHGLSSATDLVDLTLAVLEGVAYACRDGFETLRAAGFEPSELALIGGGARSAFWRQLLADALGVPLTYRVGSELGPALGAARLAMISDADDTLEAAIRRVCVQPPVRARHTPRPQRHHNHSTQLERYRRLYQLSKSLQAGTVIDHYQESTR